LQADAFSCPDSGDFNSAAARTTSNHALFEISVNAQDLFFSSFVVPSPVAKIANPAYCWGALKDKRTAPLSKSQSATQQNRHRATHIKIGYKHRSVAPGTTVIRIGNRTICVTENLS
jgi:hypothetical protein